MFMLNTLKRAAIASLVVLCCGALAWSQPAISTSYVSGGPLIYVVNGGTASVIFNRAGSNFQSLSIGPDYVDKDGAGNATHPFLLYACDTAMNQVIRFDPANTAVVDVVYNGAIAGLSPVCGRSSAAGDFFITNQAGPGVFKFAAVANQALGTLAASTPVALATTPAFPAGMTGAGITQKNVGDLLVVDSAENQVLRSPYATIPNFATQSVFASSNLGSPVGIARFSNGDVFVANSNLGNGKTAVPLVVHYNSAGSAAGLCPGISAKTNQTAQFLASAENDVLYLATQAKNSGTIWTWDATQVSCTLTALATTPTPISGIAVGPVPTGTLSQAVTATPANPTPTTFSFNSNAFQIVANGCVATVTAHPISPATVSTMISLAANTLPDGATPITNLGEGGYSVAYVAKWSGCTSVFTDGQFVTSIYGLFDNLIANNPRVVRCEGANEPLLDGSTSCQASTTVGDYPLGGIIPQDLGLTTKSTSNSTFVLVNAASGAGTSTPGTFCGYQSPLVNTTDPNQAAVFNPAVTNTIPVKFKLAFATGSCQNGPYITNAVVLISVARLTDGAGNPAFQPITISSTSVGLADVPPLFNSGNQQYQFTLNISGYAPGVYSLTATFLSDNTSFQTIVFRIQ